MNETLNSNSTIVRGKFTHPKDPTLVLVNNKGEFPAMQHETAKTWEGTFRELGKEVLGVIDVSVARRIPDTGDHVIYEAKPLKGTVHFIKPDSPYQWKPRLDDI